MNEELLDKKLRDMTETIMGGIEALNADLSAKIDGTNARIDSLDTKINRTKLELIDKMDEKLYEQDKRLAERFTSKETVRDIEHRLEKVEVEVA